MNEEIEAGALIERLAAKGTIVSRTQLTRWHGEDLLPRPRQASLGGREGSATLYPVAVVEVAIAVANLSSERRSFRWIGWQLWLLGFPVAEKFWLPRVEGAAALFDKISPLLLSMLDADDDRLAEMIANLFQAKTINPLFREVRKALGQRRFAGTMQTVVEIGSGEFSSLLTSDPESTEYQRAFSEMDLALGLRRARTDLTADRQSLLHNDPSSSAGDYTPILRRLSKTLRPSVLTEAVRTSSSEELTTAKREIVELLDALEFAGLVLQRERGRDAFGLRRVAGFRKMLSDGYFDLFIPAWLVMRQEPEAKSKAAQIASAAARLREVEARRTAAIAGGWMLPSSAKAPRRARRN